jgi:purine-nucleoside phosphorylase
MKNKVEFPYGEIPHFPVSTVAGHAGKLVVGHLAEVPIVCMQGRFHFYEGYPLWKCAMPVRVLKLMGIEVLIVTTAAGGLNEEYKVGDVMIIKDHINFPGFAGHHPLVGPNDERFGTRFPPMNTAYDKDLRILAKQVTAELGMSDFVREGVYTMVGGPNFETVAELRMLRMLGVDAVGMSTVPEVITARHCGMRILGFSLITNEAITEYDVEEEASHEEVVETGQRRQEDLKRFMTYLIPCIQRDLIPRQQRHISE